MEGEREVGVIGIEHSRKNTVYYSEEEYLKSLVPQHIPEIPIQANQNLEGDNIIPLNWLQSTRSRQSAEERRVDQDDTVSMQRNRPARK